jgi:hypothetical protein
MAPATAPEPASTPSFATAAPPASTGTRRSSKLPVVAAVVVVALLIGGFLVTRGGGGGSGASGLGTIKGHVNENGVFVHHVEVPKDSVLLVKVIPEGSFDGVLSIAADFPTIERYKNTFGFTLFGRGAVLTESESSFSGVDLTGVNGGLFVAVNDNRNVGGAEQVALPAPSPTSVDIVVTAIDGGAGDVTLQLVVRKFIGPIAGDDRGAFYDALVRQAYDNFLSGTGDINDTRDFTKQSDFTDDSDFTRFSSSFSSLDNLPK